MIPINLELKNFGAIKEADIDLRDITCAAITGRNGAGKSTAFTTAPLWALFGVTRSGSADDVINAGALDCSVSFTFEHQGQIYRVVRTRSRQGRGKSGLELQRAVVGEGFCSLSGATIKETQERIISLLNLDASTFTASSMILQGRSNEFTAKGPGERKEILAQILGLEIYDILKEGAKRRAAVIERTLAGSVERIREGHGRIEENLGVDAEILSAETEIAATTKTAESYETLLRGLEAKLSDALRAREELAAKKKLAEELRAREQAAADGAERLKSEIAKIDGLLDRENELREKAEQHEKAKALMSALDGKLARKEQLKADTQQIRAALITGGKEIIALEEKITKGKDALARKPHLEAAAKEYAELQVLIERDRENDRRTQESEKKSYEIERLTMKVDSELDSVLMQIRSCEEKAERMAASGCVNLEAAEKAPCGFLQDAIASKTMLPGLKEKAAELKTELNRLAAVAKAQCEEVWAIGYEPEEAEARVGRAKELKPYVDFLAGIEAKEELVSALEEQLSGLKERVAENQAKLEPLAAELNQLKDELALVPDLEERIADTAVAVERLKEIPVLRERRKALAEKLAESEKQICDIKEQIQIIAEDLSFAATPDSITACQGEIAACKETLALHKGQINTLHARLGALKKTRDDIENLRAEIERMEAERAPLAKELTRWQTLERAFSRNGIPALIIENAVPALERVSNEILGQMSGGEHILRFETQRELKSRDGLAETLDIVVSDWQGERPYETFSGGEQLRIDLAIRFGLAELLANRAGSKVEWMVLDEGIGSQDAEHRAMVLEAIKNVSGRFRKVLVITHIEEAQGAFPQQIHFSRKDDVVEVMAA